MRKHIKKRLFKSFVLLLAVVLTVICVPQSRTDVSAIVSEADKKAVEEQIKKNKQTLSSLSTQITSLKNDINKTMELKNAIDAEIELMEQNIELTDRLIAQYQALVGDRLSEITAREEELAESYEVFRERLRLTYEDGAMSYLEMIMSSESLSDFLVRIERVGNLLEYEYEMMQSLDRESLELKQSVEEELATTEELRIEQLNSRELLEAKRKEALNTIKQQNNTLAQKQKTQKQITAANEELDAQLDKILKELAAQAKQYVGGTFMWPCAVKYNFISSYYGARTLYGVYDFHLGIDIPTDYQAYVYAANTGTVVVATSHYSYGNYILIDHGGGYATLYAHNSKLIATVGQRVQKGDVIALAGTTGNSSGVHIHFEIRINGVTVNPLSNKYIIVPK